MSQILPSRAPAISVAPRQYDASYFDRLWATLRLYFTRVDNNNQQLLLGFNNYGEFYTTSSQTAAATGTAYAVTMTNTAASYGIVLDTGTPSRIMIPKNGVYLVAYRAQVDKSAAGSANIFVWLRVNGTNATYSGNQVEVNGATDEKALTAYQALPLNAGDYVEVVWSTSDTGCSLPATAAAAPVPGIPSVRVSVTYAFPGDQV